MSQNATTFSIASQISSSRTVFDILWSCLFAIFACTWTVQHLNIPPQRKDGGSNPGWKGDLKYELKKFWTSAKWMIITILAPELLMALNAGQLADARQYTKQLKEYAKEDGVPWSLTHSLFANMGGFVVREYTRERADASLHIEESRAKNESVQVEERGVSSEDGIHAFSEIPAGTKDPAHEAVEARIRRSQSENESMEMKNILRAGDSMNLFDKMRDGTKSSTNENLEAEIPKEPRSSFILVGEMLTLREKRIIRLPYVTREEIMDKGKSDNFARVIAIGQTLWLVVQIIVRASRHLEVSQLEVGAAAFASSAITIYTLNWYKPKGTGVPWTLCSFTGSMPKEISNELEKELENGWFPMVIINGGHEYIRGSSIPNSHRYRSDLGRSVEYDVMPFEVLCLILSSILFGAIHFGAINSTFPSNTEKIIWCVASAVCTSATVLFFLSILAILSLGDIFACFSSIGRVIVWFLYCWILFILLLYIVARLYLIIELFRCLFFLPPSALVATWVSSVPHVS